MYLLTCSKKDYQRSFYILLCSIFLSLCCAYFESLIEDGKTRFFLSGFLFTVFLPFHIGEVYRFYLIGKEASKYFARFFIFIIVCAILFGDVVSPLNIANDGKFLLLGITAGAILGIEGLLYRIRSYKKK